MIVMIIIVILEVIAGMLAFAFWPEVCILFLTNNSSLRQLTCNGGSSFYQSHGIGSSGQLCHKVTMYIYVTALDKSPVTVWIRKVHVHIWISNYQGTCALYSTFR